MTLRLEYFDLQNGMQRLRAIHIIESVVKHAPIWNIDLDYSDGCYVLFRNQRTIGVMCIHRNTVNGKWLVCRNIVLSCFCVRACFRDRGFGTWMLHQVLQKEQVLARGTHTTMKITLEIDNDEHEEELTCFFRDFGFEIDEEAENNRATYGEFITSRTMLQVIDL
jgi:ribosomal protein S18 acetylase RimI-like enzyme